MWLGHISEGRLALHPASAAQKRYIGNFRIPKRIKKSPFRRQQSPSNVKVAPNYLKEHFGNS
jgi:hypothetical protein